MSKHFAVTKLYFIKNDITVKNQKKLSPVHVINGTEFFINCFMYPDTVKQYPESSP